MRETSKDTDMTLEQMHDFISEDTILAVKKGARFLDAHYPAWEGQINLNVLWLQNANQCVLGQLEGSYTKACDKHNLAGPITVEMGFDINPIDDPEDFEDSGYYRQWDELTNAWKGLINERRGSQ